MYIVVHRFFLLISGKSRGGAQGPPTPPLFWVNKEELTEGRKPGWANKIKVGPLISSKFGICTINAVRSMVKIKITGN